MGIFDFISPAGTFGETLLKCLHCFDRPGFWQDPETMKMKILEVSGNSEAKIAIWETLKKDGYRINNDSNSLSVFIMEAYLFYLNSIGKGDRSTYKIENVDFPMIQGILKSGG